MAAKTVCLSPFPFPQIAYILRVDGEGTTYGQYEIGYPDVDKNGKYFSIDIGVTIENRSALKETILTALRSSVSFVSEELKKLGLESFNYLEFEKGVEDLCRAYDKSVG